MVYESSYECGRKPFLPDITRGHWASPSDFVFAGIGLAFRLDIFSLSWFAFMRLNGPSLLPYLICLGLYVVPIMVMQAFMGQFSSSGFISAFRLSPLFKGMGYISLALNIAILTYYSIFAAVPLVYLFNSMYPTLPWSCESVERWLMTNQTDEELHHICNITMDKISNTTGNSYIGYHLPATLFFGTQFGESNLAMFSKLENDFAVSWQMLLCTLLTWAIIAGIFWKFFQTASFGKLMRYLLCVTVLLVVICLTRFCFLSGTEDRLEQYFNPSGQMAVFSMTATPLYTLSAFGGGWGALVVLSSFNQFKTNITQQSWLIVLGQTVIWLLLGAIVFLLDNHFDDMLPKIDDYDENTVYSYVEHHWILFMSAANAIATMEAANLWSILYYTMLTLAAIMTMIIQLFSVFCSIFDEFEATRTRKSMVIFGLIGLLTIFSLFTCTSHGIAYFGALAMDSINTQTTLSLLLLLVVLWIYGRERFQRDIEFMLSLRFPTWKVNILRYVAPICLLFTWLITVGAAVYEHMISSLFYHIAAIFFIVIPWLFIPGYMIFILVQTTGTLRMRFKRCCHPNDWYPVETEDRQRYEEAVGNMDITHQLKEVDEQIVVP